MSRKSSPIDLTSDDEINAHVDQVTIDLTAPHIEDAVDNARAASAAAGQAAQANKNAKEYEKSGDKKKAEDAKVVALQQKKVAEAASMEVLKIQQDASKVRKALSELAKREAAEALAQIHRMDKKLKSTEKTKNPEISPPNKKQKRTVVPASNPADQERLALIEAQKAVEKDQQNFKRVVGGAEAKNLERVSKKHKDALFKGKGKGSLEDSQTNANKAKHAADAAQRRAASMESGSLNSKGHSAEAHRIKYEQDKLKNLIKGPCLLEDGCVKKFMKTLGESLVSKDGPWIEEKKVLEKKPTEDNCQYVVRVARVDRGIAIKTQVGSGVSGAVFFGSSQDHMHAIKVGVFDGRHNVGLDTFWYSVHAHQEVYQKIPISLVPMAHMWGAHTLARKEGKKVDSMYAFVVSMSYLHGRTVNAAMQKTHNTASIIVKFAKSLRILHDNGFSHGDAHLENFMETYRNGAPIGIVDFDRSIELRRLGAKHGSEEAEKADAARRVQGAVAYDIRFAVMMLNRAFQLKHPGLGKNSQGLWHDWVKDFVQGYTNKPNQQEVAIHGYSISLENLSLYLFSQEGVDSLWREYMPLLNFAKAAMYREYRSQAELHTFRKVKKQIVKFQNNYH